MKRVRKLLRPVLASVIVLLWLVVELAFGGIQHPTLELRLMLIAALIWMFGESVDDAVEIIRGPSNNE